MPEAGELNGTRHGTLGVIVFLRLEDVVKVLWEAVSLQTVGRYLNSLMRVLTDAVESHTIHPLIDFSELGYHSLIGRTPVLSATTDTLLWT